MKAYRMRLIGWIFIFGIFFDMITTIMCNSVSGRELNSIGYNFYLILMFYIEILFAWIIIKYYDKYNKFLLQLSVRKYYVAFTYLMFFACLVRWIVVINNLIVFYIMSNYTILFFKK